MNEHQMLQIARIMHLSGLTEAIIDERVYPPVELTEGKTEDRLKTTLEKNEKTKGASVKSLGNDEYEIRLKNAIGELSLKTILKGNNRIDLVRKVKDQPVYYVYTTAKAASLRRRKRKGWTARLA